MSNGKIRAGLRLRRLADGLVCPFCAPLSPPSRPTAALQTARETPAGRGRASRSTWLAWEAVRRLDAGQPAVGDQPPRAGSTTPPVESRPAERGEFREPVEGGSMNSPLRRGGERRGDGARPRLRTRTGEELVCGSAPAFGFPRVSRCRDLFSASGDARRRSHERDDEAASAGVDAEPAPTAVPSDRSRIGPEGRGPRRGHRRTMLHHRAGGCAGRAVRGPYRKALGRGAMVVGCRAPVDAAFFFCRRGSSARRVILTPFFISSFFFPKKAFNYLEGSIWIQSTMS